MKILKGLAWGAGTILALIALSTALIYWTWIKPAQNQAVASIKRLGITDSTAPNISAPPLFFHALISEREPRYLNYQKFDYIALTLPLINQKAEGCGSINYRVASHYFPNATPMERHWIGGELEGSWGKNRMLTEYLCASNFASLSKTFFNKKFEKLSPDEWCFLIRHHQNPRTSPTPADTPFAKQAIFRRLATFDLPMEALPTLNKKAKAAAPQNQKVTPAPFQ
ncbi:MAG: hypothetical protein AAF226_03385 [Verrucomicrobiota bacterium]